MRSVPLAGSGDELAGEPDRDFLGSGDQGQQVTVRAERHRAEPPRGSTWPTTCRWQGPSVDVAVANGHQRVVRAERHIADAVLPTGIAQGGGDLAGDDAPEIGLAAAVGCYHPAGWAEFRG
jgi:hypothetical protein